MPYSTGSAYTHALMARTVVIAPGQEVTPADEVEFRRLTAELDQIERLGDGAGCRLCGARGGLTAEHAPSRKAGNVGSMLRGTIDEHATIASGEIKFKSELVQAATFQSLCQDCNNLSGTWYNPAYVKFTRAARAVARPEFADELVSIPGAFHRQRIAKQALVSIVAMSQAGLTNRYPDLRTSLVSRDDRRPLVAPMRLWLFVKVNTHPLAMYTGIMQAIEIARHRGYLVAGFSFWPLGWILTLGDVEVVPGASDVSPWVELGYNDKVTSEISCPAQFAHEYPGDFRRPEEYPGGWRARADSA